MDELTSAIGILEKILQSNCLMSKEFNKLFLNMQNLYFLVSNKQFEIICLKLLNLVIAINSFNQLSPLQQKLIQTSQMLKTFGFQTPQKLKENKISIPITLINSPKQDDNLFFQNQRCCNSSPVSPKHIDKKNESHTSRKKQENNQKTDRFSKVNQIYVDQLAQKGIHQTKQIQQRPYNIINNQGLQR